MLICQDQRSGYGCGAENPDSAQTCARCGQSLRYAVRLHDQGSPVGHYRIGRVIGYGAFGAVYEAEDMTVQELRVAVKQTFEAHTIRNFRREFEVLSDLQHPNLPRYYQMFEEDGCGYLVMEYVPGESLEDIFMRHERPLSEQLMVAYAAQLADLLTYLHSQQPPILHRDIKPSNIRLTPEGTVKLVDFGLFKQGNQQTRKSLHGLGTLEYMPLEQFDWAGGTDQRTDIYSLGATLYHMLTGRVPISAPRRMSKENDPLTPPHKINRRLSLHISAVVMRAMQRFPQDRYPTAAAFKNDLLGRPYSAISGAHLCRMVHSHPSYVYSIACSPDGQHFATGGEDHSVRLWRTGSMELEEALTGHSDRVASVAFSPDNKYVASGSADGTVRLWPLDDLHAATCLRGHSEGVTSVAFSPDGQQLASGSLDGTVRIWSIADGSLASMISDSDRSKVYSLAWQPDGQMLATGCSDGAIRLWYLGEPITLHLLAGHTKNVFGLTWSPDGQSLVSAGADATLRLWQLANGRLISTVQQHKRWAKHLATSSLGRTIAGSRDEDEQRLWLWRVNDGSLCRTLGGHRNMVYSVAFSPDGQTIASCGADGTLRLWRADGTPICTLNGHNDWVYGLCWTPSGQQLASASLDTNIGLWEID